MNFAEEIKTTAIVGTAQKDLNLPGANGRLGETLSKFERADKEKFLLSAAAVCYAWQAAGKILPTDVQNLPEICQLETKEILSGRLKQIFETLIDSSDKSLLPEFLSLMKSHGKIIPPELLPLTLATVNLQLEFRGKDFRQKTLPVVGERGKWLTLQVAGWRWVLVEEIAEELFETSKPNERTFALEYLRNKNADAARELLLTVWKSESAAERQKLLEVLRVNLSRADETFLDEIFRTDKSAEVKRTAFDLLANLPDTKLSEEITEIFRPVLSLKKKLLVKNELEVLLPDDWNEKTLDLKTVAKQIFSNTKYFGEKALALAVGLSIINPQNWEKSLQCKPGEIAALAHKSDWARALLAGFGMAAIRFGNEFWFSEVMKFNSKFALSASPLFAWSQKSFAQIPERKIIPLVRSNPNYVFADWLLGNSRFETEEAKEIFKDTNISPSDFTSRESSYNWKQLAEILPFELIEKWISDLEKMKLRNEFNDYQKNLFDEIINTLNFRREYILEFEK